MSNKKFNFESALIGAFLALIVSVAGGLILTRIQSKEPKLVYSSTGTIPFEGQDEIIGIYYIRISNSGKKEAKEVDCVIRLEKASIKEWQISLDPAIEYTEVSDLNSINLDIPLLNPSENVELYVLASTTTTLPDKLSVSLRGEGVIGTEATVDQIDSIFPLNELSLLIALMLVLQTVGILLKFMEDRVFKKEI